ncbi:MAG: phosphatidylglycerophosphatase A [Undibacterium sp.]|nr:phosphatidylglycerophosphatase A [Opitutaceae bacterium]
MPLLTQPSWPKRLPTWLVVNVATLGPIGRELPAPGTWGSLAGVALAAVVVPALGAGGVIAFSVIAGYLAVGICGEAEVRLGRQDPGEVILDEFVAMPLCFLGWSMLASGWPTWVALAAGFALFRFFDILKPLGISRLQALPAGWGVVIDDLAAALAACAALHAVHCGWTMR